MQGHLVAPRLDTALPPWTLPLPLPLPLLGQGQMRREEWEQGWEEGDGERQG